jgi:hemoglobin-like flavoprotein
VTISHSEIIRIVEHLLATNQRATVEDVYRRFIKEMPEEKQTLNNNHEKDNLCTGRHLRTSTN